MLADKAYDAEWIRAMIEAQNAVPVIPNRSTTKRPMPSAATSTACATGSSGSSANSNSSGASTLRKTRRQLPRDDQNRIWLRVNDLVSYLQTDAADVPTGFNPQGFIRRFGDTPPTVQIAAGATPAQIEETILAVEIINAALPQDWQLEVIGDPGQASIYRPEDGTILVEFAPWNVWSALEPSRQCGRSDQAVVREPEKRECGHQQLAAGRSRPLGDRDADLCPCLDRSRPDAGSVSHGCARA